MSNSPPTPDGILRVQLERNAVSDGTGTVVVEITASAGTSQARFVPVVKLVDPKTKMLEVKLPPGRYHVRVTTPNGEVVAETLTVASGAATSINFALRDYQLRVLPAIEERSADDQNSGWLRDEVHGHYLLSSRTIQRKADRSPLIGRVNASRYGAKTLSHGSRRSQDARQHSAQLYEPLQATLWVVGGRDGVLPGQEKQSWNDNLNWWFSGSSRIGHSVDVRASGERSLTLEVAALDLERRASAGPQPGRLFVSTKDPAGGTHIGVLPHPWLRIFADRQGKAAAPVVNLVLTEEQWPWRLVTRMDDASAMSYLGFLHSGAQQPTQAVLRDASEMLFEKAINPLAAAMGAYGLLAYGRHWPDRHWRQWIKNLYNYFPRVPDGAIAMAVLHLRYGENSQHDRIDVQVVRRYALEAVRRGVPYFTHGVSLLTETLLLLLREDEHEGRSGPDAASTREAFKLVQQLGQAAVSGEYFTTLRLEDD